MIRRIVTWSAAFAGLAFTVILTNQVLQLSQFAASIHPTAGQVVFWLLLTVMGVGLAVPLILIIRLPPALVPPQEESGPDFDAHLAVLQRRLGTNVITRGRPLGSREDVESALAVLDEIASEKIEKTARRAFMATAISQNGALDAVVVFGLQARLVWDVAAVYSQRPNWRELTYLYSNVLTTAFIAGELDDADMAEAMEPALSAVLGSAAGLIPGLQIASELFVSSVMSGTANAFLTLRVGVIAREYSRAWTKPKRRTVRTMAITQAGGMLGKIVFSGAAEVSGAIGKGAGRAVTGAVTGTGRAVSSAVTGTGRAFTTAVSETGKRISETGAAIRDRLRFDSPEAEGEGETPRTESDSADDS